MPEQIHCVVHVSQRRVVTNHHEWQSGLFHLERDNNELRFVGYNERLEKVHNRLIDNNYQNETILLKIEKNGNRVTIEVIVALDIPENITRYSIDGSFIYSKILAFGDQNPFDLTLSISVLQLP